MKTSAVVLHKGKLAHYAVEMDEEHHLEARLIKYGGKEEDAPPENIHLEKHGRHCTGTIEEQELMDDIWEAVQ